MLLPVFGNRTKSMLVATGERSMEWAFSKGMMEVRERLGTMSFATISQLHGLPCLGTSLGCFEDLDDEDVVLQG